MNTVQPQSCIYSGTVRHRRFTPVEHQFSYHINLFFVRLDELNGLFSGHRLWSLNRRNLGYFRREDYMAPHSDNLESLVLQKVVDALNIDLKEPSVYLLTNLRQWGMCFNPVSFYYVYDRDSLKAIVAQVNNTPWNERHCYVIPVQAERTTNKQRFAKEFHVSPFNPLEMTYHWRSSLPGEHLSVHMENHREGRCHMDATLQLEKKTWTTGNLNRVLIRTPFNTMKVPLAIYWQALKLWLKGAPIYNHTKGDRVLSPKMTEENQL
ncbi:DUF1365 domain-containing protein [Gilvimarinus algae]|uniref:DUF1365 domain-containing protein n=1 Tax=Gilvimarinus algae TaxID=3058037 RepID=A0ABT8TEH0_9GAMM|nr:DUF1365 domain-containing protein [Gilvimarinus sp. SDUM040014]MDO3382499.1 DUF1365 domain-containing protein [Gilvimarinus sp. SDUM040014]